MAANGSLRPHFQAEEIARVNGGQALLGLFIARVGRNTGPTMRCPTIRAAFRQHDVLRATPPIDKLVMDERQTTRAARASIVAPEILGGW
jgi:hypothetical protein